ncbi:hypothetical protein OFM52_31990, partial [Escherichia coli]|nr:hypothetical protein [Escherichia coli]
LPFFTTDGNPARVRGVNITGLRRGRFSTAERLNLQRAFRLLFRSRLPLETVLAELERMDDPNIAHLVSFIRSSKRGW